MIIFNKIKKQVYDKYAFTISDFHLEKESKEYNACQFKLNQLCVISRCAKITPKKAGQFVTFWKRETNSSITPYSDEDRIDFLVVNVYSKDNLGQFVFPKSILIKKGIISTLKKEGKRAFRVYPSWDTVISKQAIYTQQWQLNYFYEIGKTNDLEKIHNLYNIKDAN